MMCRHGLTVGDPHGQECQRCDWCPACESVREYAGETCTACGYVWGEHDYA